MSRRPVSRPGAVLAASAGPRRRIATLVRHNVTLLAREPGPAISRLVMPVLLMVVLRPLYTAALGDGARGTAQSVAGMLVMFSLLGMSLAGSSVLVERSWLTLDRLRATPARPVELLIGKAVPLLGLMVVQQVVILGTGVLALHLEIESLALLCVAVVVWASTLLCVGSALAMIVRSHAELATATDIGALVLTVLGGALIPLTTMPGWAQSVAVVSPGYWAMRGLGGAIDGDRGAVLVAVGVLTGIAVLAAAVAAFRLARGWGRNRLL